MTDSHFVVDGQERAIEGAQEQIAKQCEQIKVSVAAEFAERLAGAGFIQRIILGLQMKREINCRIAIEVEKIAPDAALYWKV